MIPKDVYSLYILPRDSNCWDRFALIRRITLGGIFPKNVSSRGLAVSEELGNKQNNRKLTDRMALEEGLNTRTLCSMMT